MMRLRLQMLMPVSARCTWNRRISSRVAVSGDRLRNAANRLQLEMWLLCVCAPSLREFMSSIMRWRSALTVSVVMRRLLSWDEVEDTSILKTGHLACHRRISPWGQRSRPNRPRSGLSRSDLVPWHNAPISAGCVDVWSCDLSGRTADIVTPALLTHLGVRQEAG